MPGQRHALRLCRRVAVCVATSAPVTLGVTERGRVRDGERVTFADCERACEREPLYDRACVATAEPDGD